ncbi:MAG: GIY-YIG nuclease family protein [Clostridia bacterium]|nr:GIY-YIG nuclease family protein [Clostridia bacterium]
MYSVYIHINKFNGKVYVGITCRKPEYRWNNGKGYYKKGQSKMYNAIQKYGWENFEHKILFENLTKEEAEQKEIELIEQYKSYDDKFGYNITKGGNCVGNMTEETKRKISEANKGKQGWNKGIHIGIGEENPFYGKKHSEETKRKISEANKGRKMSEEQKEKIRQSCRKTWQEKIKNGYVMSENTKQKLSIANKGKPSAFKGCHHTKEAKEKLRQAHLGKSNSQVIAKLAETNKKSIICFDKDMNYIKDFSSVISASKELNIASSNISRCLKKEEATAKGYKFRYKEIIDEK